MKDHVKRMKRHATDWEKTSANFLSEKRLVSRRYENLPELNRKTTNEKAIQVENGQEPFH